jgi:hypothetical protein
MKRIIYGVTYNTDTSTALAFSEVRSDEGSLKRTLYLTRGGAFFEDRESTHYVWRERGQEYETNVTHDFKPLSREAAQKWIMTGQVEIYSNPFEDPPEAVAGDDFGTTVYMRVPAFLKKQIEDAAADTGVSVNVWMMRCTENCLKQHKPPKLRLIDKAMRGMPSEDED